MSFATTGMLDEEPQGMTFSQCGMVDYIGSQTTPNCRRRVGAIAMPMINATDCMFGQDGQSGNAHVSGMMPGASAVMKIKHDGRAGNSKRVSVQNRHQNSAQNQNTNSQQIAQAIADRYVKKISGVPEHPAEMQDNGAMWLHEAAANHKVAIESLQSQVSAIKSASKRSSKTHDTSHRMANVELQIAAVEGSIVDHEQDMHAYRSEALDQIQNLQAQVNAQRKLLIEHDTKLFQHKNSMEKAHQNAETRSARLESMIQQKEMSLKCLNERIRSLNL